MDLTEARNLSLAYNSTRIAGESDDTLVAQLNDVLHWIRNAQSTDEFLPELAAKLLEIDGAPYIMLPSLERLEEMIQQTGQPVEVFLYVLLCPLGRCAGVSQDTNTGAYFQVIESAVDEGMISSV